MTNLKSDDPLAAALAGAIRSGDVQTLDRILNETPALAVAKIAGSGKDCGARSLLHIATDWPGHFPNNAATVAALIAHGADVNARFTGRHSETPLHWAASSDDVAVIDALLDHGADIEAAGGVIGGGTPLADAVAFGQWHAARRLIERGAKTSLWQAAGLGLMDRIERYFVSENPPAPDEVTAAFWAACHGGQLAAAKYLLSRGAERNWIGHGGLTPLDVASQSGAADVVEWLRAEL